MSAIWDWAVEFHGRPGVDPACLALQDEHGQCVSYLLWALWAAPGPEALRRGAAVASAWSRAVLDPLRGVRRAAKANFAGVDEAARLTLREAVKANEMEAEAIMLDALAQVAARAGEPRRDPLAVLTEASEAWGGTAAPISAFEILARAFSGA